MVLDPEAATTVITCRALPVGYDSGGRAAPPRPDLAVVRRELGAAVRLGSGVDRRVALDRAGAVVDGFVARGADVDVAGRLTAEGDVPRALAVRPPPSPPLEQAATAQVQARASRAAGARR